MQSYSLAGSPADQARRVALCAAPAAFVFAMFVQHGFGVNWRLFELAGDFVGFLDQHPFSRFWFGPVVFGLLPFFSVVANSRSMLCGSYAPDRRELTLVIRLQFANVLALCLAGTVLGAVFGYQWFETFRGYQ